MTRQSTALAESRALLIGCSAGGLQAMKRLLPHLPAEGSFALLVAYHLGEDADTVWLDVLRASCPWPLSLALDKERVENRRGYFAPPGYHMLVERDGCIALSVEEKVNHSRPSIDVLFESVACRHWEGLAAVVLTGASNDAARGCRAVSTMGGFVYIQDPAEAEFSQMPAEALASGGNRRVGTLDELCLVMQNPFADQSQHTLREVDYE